MKFKRLDILSKYNVDVSLFYKFFSLQNLCLRNVKKFAHNGAYGNDYNHQKTIKFV